MATISFLAGEGFNIQNVGGSGLGFYGDSGFGYSVAVGSYQGRSYITDSTGTVQGPEVDNLKYNNSSSAIIGQAGSGVGLTSIPNYQSTLNIRFAHGSAIKTQNAKLYAYDRSNKNNNPSGVTVYGAELIHPSTTQGPTGSGDAAWISIGGSGSVLDLVASPGVSGERPNGANTTATQHDWYVALSVSPNSVGSKTFGCWFELEYL